MELFWVVSSACSRRDPAFPIPGIPQILNFPFPVQKLAGSRFPTFLHFWKVLCYCEVFWEKCYLNKNKNKMKKQRYKGMSSTFPKVRKMCLPNFRKIFSENFPNFRKIFSFFPKVRKNIFRKFGKIKFRCSHLLSILVRFLSQSSLSKTNFYQFHSQFGSYENQNRWINLI